MKTHYKRYIPGYGITHTPETNTQFRGNMNNIGLKIVAYFVYSPKRGKRQAAFWRKGRGNTLKTANFAAGGIADGVFHAVIGRNYQLADTHIVKIGSKFCQGVGYAVYFRLVCV
jgi:hypothetical protein